MLARLHHRDPAPAAQTGTCRAACIVLSQVLSLWTPDGTLFEMTDDEARLLYGRHVATRADGSRCRLGCSEDQADAGVPTDTGWDITNQDAQSAMPLGRWGQPDDAARLIAWLCSDEAAWITGQIIDSEGGFRR
jgi:hypothetical protein